MGGTSIEDMGRMVRYQASPPLHPPPPLPHPPCAGGKLGVVKTVPAPSAAFSEGYQTPKFDKIVLG